MKRDSMICLFVIASAVGLTHCKREHQQVNTRVTDYTVPGNLELTRPDGGCRGIADVDNTYTPPDLYSSMVACANAGNYPAAIQMFAIAGTYTFYDRLRVADVSARQAHVVLLDNSMHALDEARRNELWEKIKATLGNPNLLPSVCKEIVRIGAPRYYPRYMIQHGVGAFRGDAGDGLVGDFEPVATWSKSLDGYLHCAG